MHSQCFLLGLENHKPQEPPPPPLVEAAAAVVVVVVVVVVIVRVHPMIFNQLQTFPFLIHNLLLMRNLLTGLFFSWISFLSRIRSRVASFSIHSGL